MRMWLRLSIILITLGSVPAQAKNVILFIGDGMGISTVTAARIYAGQTQGQSGEEYNLSFDKFDHTALIKTYNVDAQVPDSAGTISAILTGAKTRMGVLGVSADAQRGDCKQALQHQLPTLLELVEDSGKKSGVVTTTRITHATPAGTYAHIPERNWEADVDLSSQAVADGCKDIARQLVEFDHGDGIDVILGGGRAQFMRKDQNDPEYPSKTGKREDTDLISQWLSGSNKRTYIWDKSGFDAYAPKTGSQLLGLFQPSHLQFEADRDKDPSGEPSLAEMTAMAIRQLQQSDDGYFLLVEAGRIDHAHHFGNAYRALVDTVALSDAVAVASDMTKSDDTLIIVTADHSHTLTISGYPPRGNPILGKVVTNPVFEDAKDAAYTTLGYANGPGYQSPYPDLSKANTEDPDYRQIAAVPLAVETHAGEDVAAFAQGPGAKNIRGVMEQNKLFNVMRDVLFAQDQ